MFAVGCLIALDRPRLSRRFFRSFWQGRERLAYFPACMVSADARAELFIIPLRCIYVLAGGRRYLSFPVPILIMALSDTGAAVVGKRYGIVQYRVIEDYRSLGGSTTFFGVTFALVLVAQGIAGVTDLPSVLIVTLLVWCNRGGSDQYPRC